MSGYAQRASMPQTGISDGHEVVVPPDLVARSRPMGHSVPIVRTRQKRSRTHPYRNLAIPVLIAVVSVFGLILAVDFSVATGQDAGYHLACVKVSTGRGGEMPSCHWEK
jgi:hypothetical protein